MSSLCRWSQLAALITVIEAVHAAGSTGHSRRTDIADVSSATHAFYVYLFVICGSLVSTLVVWRMSLESIRYIRTLTCLSNDTQRYFLKPSPWFAAFKDMILYAPIFRNRHNREFRLSAAVHVGTLPTRLQVLFL